LTTKHDSFLYDSDDKNTLKYNKGFIINTLIILSFIISPMLLSNAYGQACTGNSVLIDGHCRQCYELGTCDFFAHPLDTMLEPFLAVFGAYFYIIIWGLLMGILWLRVSNTMVVGIVGLVLAGIMQAQFTAQTWTIGLMLLGIALTVLLYQIFTVRTHFPTN